MDSELFWTMIRIKETVRLLTDRETWGSEEKVNNLLGSTKYI